jgi:hypothetical protein
VQTGESQTAVVVAGFIGIVSADQEKEQREGERKLKPSAFKRQLK